MGGQCPGPSLDRVVAVVFQESLHPWAWGCSVSVRELRGQQQAQGHAPAAPVQPPGLFSCPLSPGLLHRKTCLPACARHPSLGGAWRGSLRTRRWAPPASLTPASRAWLPPGGRRNGAGGRPSGRRTRWLPILVQRSWRQALRVSHPRWKSRGRSPWGMSGAEGVGTPPGVHAVSSADAV